MKKCVGFLFVVISVIRIGASGFDAGELASVGSYTPESENFIHIGGGFFSYFDRLNGRILAEGESVRNIRFSLSGMGWESRFHYLPEGSVLVEGEDGTVAHYTMQRLEYIPDPEGSGSLYRLTAAVGGRRLVIICNSDYSGGAKAAVLEGEVLITDVSSQGSASSVPFRLTGRDEHNAERYLNRVVTAVSDFSGMER